MNKNIWVASLAVGTVALLSGCGVAATPFAVSEGTVFTCPVSLSEAGTIMGVQYTPDNYRKDDFVRDPINHATYTAGCNFDDGAGTTLTVSKLEGNTDATRAMSHDSFDHPISNNGLPITIDTLNATDGGLWQISTAVPADMDHAVNDNLATIDTRPTEAAAQMIAHR